MRLPVLLLFLTISVIMAGSKCDSDKSVTFCGVSNPLKNIEWLKERVENAEHIEVFKLTYLNTEYISINNCPGCPDNMTEIFDCNGNRFCTIGGITGRNTCPVNFIESAEKVLILKKGD